jgi:hypothetical protein
MSIGREFGNAGCIALSAVGQGKNRGINRCAWHESAIFRIKEAKRRRTNGAEQNQPAFRKKAGPLNWTGKARIISAATLGRMPKRKQSRFRTASVCKGSFPAWSPPCPKSGSQTCRQRLRLQRKRVQPSFVCRFEENETRGATAPGRERCRPAAILLRSNSHPAFTVLIMIFPVPVALAEKLD